MNPADYTNTWTHEMELRGVRERERMQRELERYQTMTRAQIVIAEHDWDEYYNKVRHESPYAQTFFSLRNLFSLGEADRKQAIQDMKDYFAKLKETYTPIPKPKSPNPDECRIFAAKMKREKEAEEAKRTRMAGKWRKKDFPED